MKRFKLIARDSIEGIRDDKGLKALDAYYESNIGEFSDEASNDYIFETLYSQLPEECKQMFNPSFELIDMNKKSF